jgi:UPF0755 protein
VVAAAAAAGFVYWREAQPYKGYEGSERYLELAPGSSTAAIGQALVDAGVVRDRLAFRLALWRTGASRRLRAGEYRFDQPMTAVDVVSKIARGDVVLRPITFREGLTVAEMAGLYEEQRFGPAAAFREAATDVTGIEDLDPAARDLEGYLFPETYSLSRRTTARELMRQMVTRFRQVFPEALRREAAEQGFSVREAVTLASIVEKETGKPEERPLVAAVYRNRLKIGMGLQCDPTVIYGLQRARRFTGNLTRADLQFDSPYNTYRYAGLPPGPIAAPGRASLEAAVRPAAVPYLYFVSRNDGSHEFARTLDEHNRNVFKYQVLYFRQKRLAK